MFEIVLIIFEIFAGIILRVVLMPVNGETFEIEPEPRVDDLRNFDRNSGLPVVLLYYDRLEPGSVFMLRPGEKLDTEFPRHFVKNAKILYPPRSDEECTPVKK